MSHSLIFSDDAQHDLIESIQWYNEAKQNLGFEFYDHVKEKLSQLIVNPLHYSVRFKTIRATKVNQYPYLIYFNIDNKTTTILILGVLHTSRNPQTIRKRKQ